MLIAPSVEQACESALASAGANHSTKAKSCSRSLGGLRLKSLVQVPDGAGATCGLPVNAMARSVASLLSKPTGHNQVCAGGGVQVRVGDLPALIRTLLDSLMSADNWSRRPGSVMNARQCGGEGEVGQLEDQSHHVSTRLLTFQG